ncbi:MAG: DUF1641 domain-containing protein [Nitrospirales bacterium]|nr:DUF1641 domain-containing protein [Nitrospirales bacterium]
MEEVRDIQERLSDPKTVETLNHLLDRLTELHQTGVLDSFAQTIQAVTFLKDGLTDTMVNKNASMISELMEVASEAASPEIKDSLRELKQIHRSGKLRDLFDLTDNISFLLNSTTEKMLERNASIMGELYNIANEAADPDMAEAVRELKNLQKSGNLKTLSDASYMLAFLSNAVTDSMVQRIASFGATFVEEVATPQIQDILKSTTKCLASTIQQFAAVPPQPGIKSLAKVMTDPEVQMGMIFMATLAKNMHQCMVSTYTGE